MMATVVTIHVRVDEKVKTAATKVLAEMGLSISEASRMMLTRVAKEKALPFDLVPNAVTIRAMRSRGGKRFSTVEEALKDLSI